LNTKLKSIKTTPFASDLPYYGLVCAPGTANPGPSTCALNAPTPTADVGGPIALTPLNKVSATANYVLPLASRLGKMSVGLNYVLQSGFVVTAEKNSPNHFKLPGYGLTNMNYDWVAIYGSRFDLGVFATNVFDQRYGTYSPGLFSNTGFETETVGPPRMYGADVSVHFGG